MQRKTVLKGDGEAVRAQGKTNTNTNTNANANANTTKVENTCAFGEVRLKILVILRDDVDLCRGNSFKGE